MSCLTQVSATEFTGDTTGLPSLPTPAAVLPVSGYTRRYVAGQLTNPLGSDVISWPDVNNANPLTTAGVGGVAVTNPSLILDGSIKAVSFDGLLDGLGVAYALPQPFTLVLVARFVNAVPGVVNFVLSGGGATIFITSSVKKLQLNAGLAMTMNAVPDTSWHVFIAAVNSTASTIRQDAAILGPGNAGTTAKSGILLAREWNGYPAQCNIAEYMIYPTALVTADQDVLVTSLKTRYGI